MKAKLIPALFIYVFASAWASEQCAQGQVVRVAAVQMRMRWYRDTEDFRATIHGWVCKAKEAGATLVVFPEDVGLPLIGLGDYELLADCRSSATALPLLAKRHFKTVMELIGKYEVTLPRAPLWAKREAYWPAYKKTFAEAARRFEVYIAAGTAPRPAIREPPRIYNTGLLFDPRGRVLGRTTKVNLVPLEQELLDLVGAEEKTVPLFDTPIGAIAMPICYDCYSPKLLRPLGKKGVEILVDPRANPERWLPAGKASLENGLKKRVEELKCFGIECFMIGEWMGIPFEGRTWILAPPKNGRTVVLATAESYDQEELIVADLNLSLVRKSTRGVK